jgi:hypothetical protein
MVDNTIALQVRPFQMPDVGQIYGQAQNIQMNRMRMAEAQETAQERNALRGLMAAGVDLNTPEGLNQLRRAAPMLAPQFEQAASQRAYQTAQAARLRAQTQADQIKTARDLLSGVSNQAQWDAWRRSTVAALPEYADAIPTQFSPQNVQRVAEGAEGLIRRASAGGERAQAQSAREQRITDTMATFGVDRATALGLVDNIISVVPGSAGEEPVLVNKLTGEMIRPRMGAARPAAPPPPGEERPPIDLRRPPAVVPTAPPTNMMLPGATAAAAPTSVEDFYAGRRQRQVEQAGQTALAQARAQAVVRGEEQPARVQEAGATTGAQETARLEARSAATQRAEAAQLDTAISELQRISAPGGLLERSTGSGVGRLVDIAGEFIGVSSRAAKAAAALAPIADVVLKLVPRFEGPQSDRDTRSYQEAAGRLADPTIPNETRLAAAREIIRLMRNRRDQFQFGEGGAARPAAAAPATPQAVPPVPAGVNMPQAEWSRLWGVMSPQERALWQN